MKLFFIWLLLLLMGPAFAQSPTDSVRTGSARLDSVHMDTVQPKMDTLLTTGLASFRRDSIKPQLQVSFSSDSFRYRPGLFYRFTNPVRYTISQHVWQGRDVIFYLVIAVLLAFAVIKAGFGRYLTDLLSSYFRTSVRQRQIKDQLQQSPLPSLLFNAFFIVSVAVFLGLLLQKFNLAGHWPFWLVVLACAIGLLVVYAGKFVCLKFLGWVFAQPEITDSYIFIVFSTNKIMGVLLLPFTVLLAFTTGGMQGAAATISLIIIGCLLVYRYFLSFLTVSRMIVVQPFHFLIYLLAFEVLPVLLINKLLFLYLREIA